MMWDAGFGSAVCSLAEGEPISFAPAERLAPGAVKTEMP